MEHGFKDALIVSDPLHMKRAMRMAADYGITAYSSPTPTTRFVSLRSKLPFLAREVFFYIGYKMLYDHRWYSFGAVFPFSSSAALYTGNPLPYNR